MNLSISRIFPHGFTAHYAQHYACNKTIESFSNDISDENEDVKKAVDLLGKASTLMCITLISHISLSLLHNCNLKMPNFKFCGVFFPLSVVPK